MSGNVASLQEREIVQVTGEDAKSFLQGLITNNMERVSPACSIYAALLSPQGKFLHDFFIIAHESGYLLDCQGEYREGLIQRLRKYKLRAEVAIEKTPLTVAALWGAATDKQHYDTAILYPDPRLPALGHRAILFAEDSLARFGLSGFVAASSEDYERHRIALGVPVGYRDLIPEKSFPLDYGFEPLNGVDFTKGCYVGQEVTARMKHRGVLRKQVYIVSTEDTALPQAGMPVLAGDATIGEMRSSLGNRGLALIRRDMLEGNGSTAPLRTGDRAVAIMLPAWAS